MSTNIRDLGTYTAHEPSVTEAIVTELAHTGTRRPSQWAVVEILSTGHRRVVGIYNSREDADRAAGL